MIIYSVITAVIVLLSALIVLILSFVIAYRRGNYAYCVRLVKRAPILVDRNGAVRPEMVAAAGIRARDFDFARRWIDKSAQDGMLPVHYLLHVLLFAEKGDWGQANETLKQLTATTALTTQEIDPQSRQDMEKMAALVKEENLPSLRELSREII